MKTAPTLLTVPEMGKILGLIENLWPMNGHYEITTIHPDGSRHEYQVLIDDEDGLLDSAAFWCVWNDGNFQRDRVVPAAFLTGKPAPKTEATS